MQLRSHSHRHVVDPSATSVVSLTTYGSRVRTVHLAIESIGLGTVLPGRLILWLDAADSEKLPRALERARRRGVEIRQTRAEWGPHKKYFPYCLEYADDNRLLITADDDVFYPKNWLDTLIAASNDQPACVWAHRVRVIKLMERPLRFAPYLDWPLAQHNRPSPTCLPTGVGGVAYPPQLQMILRDAGDGFMTLCPRADDMWLHLHQLRHGITAGQVSVKSMEPLDLPGSQRTALALSNQDGGMNDMVLDTLYSESDIEALRQAGA